MSTSTVPFAILANCLQIATGLLLWGGGRAGGDASTGSLAWVLVGAFLLACATVRKDVMR